MEENLNSIENQLCFIEKNIPIVVGVSGGADSISLVNILQGLGFTILAAHLNHGIRPEAGEDASRVEKFADSLGITSIIEEVSSLDYAEERGLSLEEAGRILRYQFLFSKAKIFNAQAVVVAHNADDQVETILMHLLRGSGLDGLRGMSYRSLPNSWSKSIPLIRPLLGIWREQIIEYCNVHNLNPIYDQSNQDIRFLRNQIRHELIPELVLKYPGLKQRLWQSADLIKADGDVLDQINLRYWDELYEDSGEGWLAINWMIFDRQPLGIKRRLVRKAIEELRPNTRDVNYALVQRVIELSSGQPKPKNSNLGMGLHALREKNYLYFYSHLNDLPTDGFPQIAEEVSLRIPGIFEMKNGWKIQVKAVKNITGIKQKAENNQDPFQVWIDTRDQLGFLQIRKRAPGDWIAPLGMGGKTQKLSDLMINKKIPYRARSKWPIVCLGKEIAWIPGCQLSHHFRLYEETSKVVHIHLYKN